MADFISDYKRIVTYVQISVQLLCSACIWLKSKSAYNERWLCSGQRFSDSEWNRILKAADLVVFGVLLGITAWVVLISIENFYLIIDCGTIHTLWIIKKYLYI